MEDIGEGPALELALKGTALAPVYAGEAVNLEEQAEFNRLWLAFIDEALVASR